MTHIKKIPPILWILVVFIPLLYIIFNFFYHVVFNSDWGIYYYLDVFQSADIREIPSIVFPAVFMSYYNGITGIDFCFDLYETIDTFNPISGSGASQAVKINPGNNRTARLLACLPMMDSSSYAKYNYRLPGNDNDQHFYDRNPVTNSPTLLGNCNLIVA